MHADKGETRSKVDLSEVLESTPKQSDWNEDRVLERGEMPASAREPSGGEGPIAQFGCAGGGAEFLNSLFERGAGDKGEQLTGVEIPPFMRKRIEQTGTSHGVSSEKSELAVAASRLRGRRGGDGERATAVSDDNVQRLRR